MTQRFDTSEAPHITVACCGGDLTVVGADQRQVVIEGQKEEPAVERQGEALTITAERDCVIRCPAGATVTIKQVDGDLAVQGLQGPLAVALAQGDVTLRGVGHAALNQAGGDLAVRGVQGELSVAEVRGDAKVRQVTGKVTLESVRGDLAVRDLEAGAVVDYVGGDVSLSTTLAGGASYHFEADGDISAKVEVGGGARCTLEGGELHCRLPLQFSERSVGRIVGSLGDGSAELIMRAGGDLSVTGRGESWEQSSVQWESAMESWGQQFDAQMTDMQRKLEERLAGIPFVDDKDVARRSREAAERARRQAERATERARMRAERAGRRHAQYGPAVRWTGAPPQPPRPPAEPISDAERMAILKMVQDKKITADQAARLLAALEGEA